jgi:hypothetical protein
LARAEKSNQVDEVPGAKAELPRRETIARAAA